MTLHFNRPAAVSVIQEVSPLIRFLLWALAVVLMALALKGPSPEAIRWSGGLLEILGLSTVAVEIAQLRDKFGLPGVKSSVVRIGRMIRAVFSPRRHILAAGTGHIRAGATVSGRGRVTLAPGAPLHRRITLLEKQVEQLEELLVSIQRQLRDDIQKTRDEMSNRLAEQQVAQQAIAERVKDVAVGGSSLQIVGWMWLLLGVIAATFPNELASLFGMPV